MRDGTRQAADIEPVDGRAQRYQPLSDDVDPNASERITLIEFLWEGPLGAQQVILVAREWLQ